jgi:taurine dioxygenase
MLLFILAYLGGVLTIVSPCILPVLLADHIVKPAHVYRHQWRPGDLLMWDNYTVQHRAIQDYDLPQRRLMHRTTMGGSAPV